MPLEEEQPPQAAAECSLRRVVGAFEVTGVLVVEVPDSWKFVYAERMSRESILLLLARGPQCGLDRVVGVALAMERPGELRGITRSSGQRLRSRGLGLDALECRVDVDVGNASSPQVDADGEIALQPGGEHACPLGGRSLVGLVARLCELRACALCVLGIDARPLQARHELGT